MADSCSNSSRYGRVALVIAANVTGGHEFQSRALADDLANLTCVTVFLNAKEHLRVFEGTAADVKVEPGLFLAEGKLGVQIVHGFRNMRKIRRLLNPYDRVIVCAGAVEAAVCTGIALTGRKRVSLYLPFFSDRIAYWGKVGCAYNLLLGCFGLLYSRILTINRIQAKLIGQFMHRPTHVIPNLIREVPPVTKEGLGRIIYIGRLDSQKRVPEMLRWLDYSENPYQEVVLIGDGPQRAEVIAAAAQLKYIKATILGWQWPHEQDQFICKNDVLVLNSVIEGEPLVIREANQRGISVIAPDIAGVKGITFRGNRFRSDQSVHLLLTAARSGNLPKKTERRRDDIVQQRLRSVYIFLTQSD